MRSTIFKQPFSIKTRLIAGLLAFVVIFVGLPYVSFNSELDVTAATITTGSKFSDYSTKGTTGSTTHDGYSVSKANQSNISSDATFEYEYTGKIKSTKVSLYDYFSDAEIAGGTPESMYTNYGCEPFDTLNMAISNFVNNSITQQDKNKIVITYKPDGSRSIGANGIKIYLWKDSPRAGDNNWPPTRQMAYDNVNGCYTYTFDCNTESFVPDRVIFYGADTQWQTNDIVQIMEAGNRYAFTEGIGNTIAFLYDSYGLSGSGAEQYIYMWKESDTAKTPWNGDLMYKVNDYYWTYSFDASSFVPENVIFNNTKAQTANLKATAGIKKGYTYFYKYQSSDAANTYVHGLREMPLVTISKIYNSQFEIPLYFGCFYRNSQNANVYTEREKPKGQIYQWADGSAHPTMQAGGLYSNFYWQANLGQKSIDNGIGSNSVDIRGHAAVQGLVDDKLTTDSAPTIADPSGKLRQNGVEMPYFSTDFEAANPTLMKIKDNNGAGIDFPFYEIKADATKVRGTVTNSSAEARFYQFNSADNNLKLTGSAGDWHFEETDIQITSNNNIPGYFPFDTQNSKTGDRIATGNNLGFGTRFEMRFKLKEDGQVYPVNSNGNEIKDDAQKIHTMFEFIGDDDLWVFIDGNLVLDLGGCHDQTSGLIDFADKKAYANKAMNIKEPGNNKDNLGASVGLQTLQGNAFTDKIAGYDSVTGKYDKNTTHTMTIYYLERGMMDSNLLVRFNFTPESTFSKMKIAEVTDFSTVNDGLKSYTRKAADDDVFKYTVSNKGTSTSDVVKTGILYPTYDQYDRRNKYVSESDNINIKTTTLTKQNLATTQREATDSIFLNTSGSYWEEANAIMGAWIGPTQNSDDGRNLFIGKKVADHIYEFTNFPASANYVKFMRLDPAKTYANGGVSLPSTWGISADKTIQRAKTYQASDWNTVADAGSDSYYFYDVNYQQNTYNPGTADSTYKPVANTNYLWEDNMKALVGAEQDEITGMTGKTTASGELYLMYGTGRPYGDGKESSAEFENAFRPATSINLTPSSMRIVQSQDLFKTDNALNSEFSVTTTSRSVKDYYKTTVQLFDRQSNTRNLSKETVSGYDDIQTTFDFKHVANTDSGFTGTYKAVDPQLTVMLTEVFTNEVRVGAISVTKELVNSGEADSVDDEFEFTLVLTKVFGTDGSSEVNVSDYSGITIGGDAISINGDGKLTSDGRFKLKAGKTATIYGIPVGTHYSITETTPTTNYLYNAAKNDAADVKAGVLIASWVGTDDYSAPSHYIPDDDNKAVFTNERKTGSLTVKKKVEGTSDALSVANVTASGASATPFSYTVNLYAPANVDFRHYLVWTNLTSTFGGTDVKLNGSSTATTSEADYNHFAAAVTQITMTVSVAGDAPKTISGLPYGTQYTVEETTSYLNGTNNVFWQKSGEVTSRSSSNEINSTGDSREVEITNKYTQIGTLTLNKDVVIPTGSTINSSVASETKEFVYEITLQAKDSSVDLSEFITPSSIIGYDSSYGTITEYWTGSSGSVKKYTFRLNVSEKINHSGTLTSGSKTISNIPVGTTYTVTEVYTFNGASNPGIDYQKDGEKGSTTDVADRTIAAGTNNTTNAVTITNTYTQVGELNLSKTAQEKKSSTAFPSSVSVSNKTFTFNVTLKAPSGVNLTKYVTNPVSFAESGGTYNSSQYSFQIKVKSGEAAKTISNIPYGTQYIVEEVTETPINDYKLDVTGEVHDSANDAEKVKVNSTTQSVSIFNTYTQLGKLKLAKVLDSSIRGKTTTGGVVIGDTTPFTYKVTLTAEDTVDLRDYLTWTYLNGTISASNIKINNSAAAISNESAYTAARVGSVEFTVSVSKDVPKQLEGLPFGTVYIVEEIPPEFSGGTCVVSGSPSGTIGTIASGAVSGVDYYTDSGTNYNQATITNSYAGGGKLTLNKQNILTPGSTAPAYPSATFKVTLKLHNDTNWALPSGVQIGTHSNESTSADGKEFSFDVTVTEGTPVDILTNVPLDEIDYKVTETTPTISGDSSYHCTKSDEVDTFTTITSTLTTQSVTIKNTWTQYGKLTVKKALGGTTAAQNVAGVTDSTQFTYVVTLTAPDNKTWSEISALGIAIPSGSIDETKMTVTFSAGTNGVSVDQSREIDNIPYGTSCTVHENAPTYSLVYLTYTAPSDGTIASVSSTAHEVTLTNTYELNTQTLTLAKALGGTDAAKTAAGVTNSTQFTYVVTLTAPSGSNWDTLNTNGVFTTPTNGEIDSTDRTKMTVTFAENTNGVSVSGPKTITGIPYGTTFEVVETTNKSSSGVVRQFTTDAVITPTSGGEALTGADANEINAIAKTVTITNTYEQTGSLTLRKIITGTTLSGALTFYYNVILRNDSVDLKQFITGQTFNISGVTISISDPAKYTSNYIEFEVPMTVSAGEMQKELTLSDLPQGTTVSVSEGAMPSANWSQTASSNTANATITGGETTTASITNTYTLTSITLFKQDATSHAGIPGAKFYLLRLKPDVDIENETIKAAFVAATSTSDVSAYADIVGSLLTTGDGTTSDIGTIIVPANNSTITFTTGERYFFFEDTPGTTTLSGPVTVNYKKDNTLSAEKIITINSSQIDYTVTYDNERVTSSENVEITKKKKGEEVYLGGAVFDLFYQETTIPKIYASNNPFAVPSWTATKSVINDLAVPADEIITTQAAPPTYTYEYKSVEVPGSSDMEWILPRSDNDYIYFRDYNEGTTYSGDYKWNQDNKGGQSAEGTNRRWINTWFDSNEFGQSEEIFYDHRYWLKAVFTAPNKETREYSVWERFVDDYNGEKTVVWKIQPPDGYKYAEFILCDGDTHVRNTVKFEYVLGNIYTKSNKGIYDGGQYGYPVVGKHWSTNWNGTGNTASDKRQNYSTVYNKTGSNWSNTTNIAYTGASGTSSQQSPKQTDRYTPTEQKIVFHCNSKKVWHNIHIEFFKNTGTDASPVYTPVGQGAPGYMMEPYAYAGDNYRINGYLTYELTIPAEATHFRVNNGVNDGSYNFYSSITALHNADDRNGRKNYGNYFKIADGSRNMTSQPITLTDWTSYPTGSGKDSWNESYSALDVNSDYDYVYFEAPTNWGSHVYAYFYGGGDLRKDNWQRACYSIWPGEAPVGSDYNDGTANYSDIYGYSYTGSLYGTSQNAKPTNPETTFSSGGKTIYKFRIPKGDRTNYKKVIFNNGLSTQVQASGTNGSDGKLHETGVISYKAGYLYNKKGESTKFYENKPTSTYQKRGSGDDYIYIRIASTDTATDNAWDDMHITFYNSNNAQILQRGDGYVMEYSGTKDVYKYYRMAIPTNASKFALNNGYNSTVKTSSGTYYDILRLDTVGSNTATDYTKDRIVYTLTGSDSNSTLTLAAPYFVPHEELGTPASISVQSDNADYTQRNSITNSPDIPDYLYIRDDASWNIGIGSGKVKFYDENGALINGNGTGGNGTYTLIKTQADSDSKVWYKVSIPQNASTFAVSYITGSSTLVATPTYDIYPYGASGTDGNHTETGNMYYKTETGGKLSNLNTVDSTPQTYSYPARPTTGVDYLYLVCANKAYWNGMTVSFNDSSSTSATPEYLGEITYDPISPISGVSTSDPNAAGHWFRIPIPDGATSFTATSSDSNRTSTGTIFEWRASPTRYAESWTTDGMQYRLPDISGKSTLLYPVFTEEELQSTEMGGQTVYSEESVKVDISQLESFTTASPAKQVEKQDDSVTYPVLYQTDDSKVTYEWTVDNVYFKNDQNWSTVTCKFYNGSDVVSTQSATGSGIKSFAIPNATVTKVEFSNGSTSCDFTLSNGRSDAINKICEYVQSGSGSSGYSKQNYIYLKILDDNKYVNPNNTSQGLSQSWNDSKVSLTRTSTTPYEISPNPQASIVTVTLRRADTQASIGSVKVWKVAVDPTEEWEKVKFYDPYHSSWGETIGDSDITFYGGYTQTKDLTDYGVGNYFTFSNNYYLPGENSISSAIVVEEYVDNLPSYEWKLNDYNAGSSVNYSATYQPEDRYGYITDVKAFSDTNNFIYINTSLPDPTIHFYSGENGSGTITDADADIKLNYTKVNNDDTVTAPTSPYAIRLPREAKSFVLKAGGKSVTQNLYEDGFHHAGTTFTVAVDSTDSSKLAVTGTVRRTTSRSDVESDVTHRTDGDYVFFTDTGNTFANSNTVYAYFYSDVDGEYKPWPGVKASTTTQDNTTYLDNSGNRVYKFRIPKDSNGKYQKVIFTDGVENNSSRKITEAMDIEAGKNYVLGSVIQTTGGSPANITYGSFSNYVYDAEVQTKASSSTINYSNTNKYIYIINNGTQNSTNTSERTLLDEMHVTFYDADRQVIGTDKAGYLPDRLLSATFTEKDDNENVIGGPYSDIYRIQVPSEASYFQINNGINKGSGTSKERYSVIEPVVANGLYKFVESTTANDVAATFQTSNLSTNKYNLKLVNKVEQDDEIIPIRTGNVKLATVVTDGTEGETQGKIKYIQWLKPRPKSDSEMPAGKTYDPDDSSTYQVGTVDTEYLNHVPGDIGAGAAIKQVKVVKKGTYYWAEKTPPTGYKLNETHLVFEVKDDGVYYYDENNELVKVDSTHTMVIENEPQDEVEGEVILTKTAKEQVGTTEIGSPLAGAKFLLKNAADGSTAGLTFTEGTLAGSKTYTIGSGSFNTGTYYLETGADGMLHVKGLPIGDYYLEEMEAPNGFSNKDSNDRDVNNVPQNKKIYFSVGENRAVKEITASDEMAPAYIRLFEHINDYKPTEWGNPTFIFKITENVSGKTSIVSLTVDDNGVSTTTVGATTYTNWYDESTTEPQYQGMYHIDSDGRIRVAPGSYEIARIPVSRYEFVTSASTEQYTGSTPGSLTETTNDADHEFKQKVIINTLESGKTVDVHYYDQIAYYDKFSQVDKAVNQFYTLDNDKKNTTIKGIRIADYKQNGTSDTAGDVMTVNVSDLTIYKIMSDGTEVEMLAIEKAALTGTNFTISYTAKTGDSADFAASVTGFYYNTSSATPEIVVNQSSEYKNGVYTLDAEYNGFKTSFDIVFLRS